LYRNENGATSFLQIAISKKKGARKGAMASLSNSQSFLFDGFSNSDKKSSAVEW
jgi:hypothetical protein